MTTPGTRAGWFSGAIAAAAVAIACSGPASMIHPQAHQGRRPPTSTPTHAATRQSMPHPVPRAL